MLYKVLSPNIYYLLLSLYLLILRILKNGKCVLILHWPTMSLYCLIEPKCNFLSCFKSFHCNQIRVTLKSNMFCVCLLQSFKIISLILGRVHLVSVQTGASNGKPPDSLLADNLACFTCRTSTRIPHICGF